MSEEIKQAEIKIIDSKLEFITHLQSSKANCLQKAESTLSLLVAEGLQEEVDFIEQTIECLVKNSLIKCKNQLIKKHNQLCLM